MSKSNRLTVNAAAIAEEEALATNKPLTGKSRDDLPDTDFAIPSHRRYPIHDVGHARNALAQVAQHGSAEDIKRVHAAVSKRYPEIGGDEAQGDDAESQSLDGKKKKAKAPTKNAAGNAYANQITINLEPTVRYELLDGQKYAVCPMVMITEGVHAGSNGPLYYPGEELAKTPAVWNHKPIVIHHPTMNGSAVSACDPQVISRRKVGLIFNTKYVSPKRGAPGKLTAEAWLQVDKLAKIAPDVHKAVLNKQMVEVSTGLFTDNEAEDGQWHKESYEWVARNHRPDHLAILPDEVGACSIKDGAGLMRNSSKMSHSDIRDQLSEKIRSRTTLPNGLKGNETGSPWVQDVYGTFCIYSHGAKMYSQGYEMAADGGTVALKGAPTEVRRKQQYTSLDGKVLNTTGVQVMKKSELIDALIGNASTQWTDDDREDLEGMDRGVLEKMLPLSVTANAGITRKDGQDRIDSGGDDAGETVEDAKGQIAAKKGGKSGTAMNKGKAAKDDECEDDGDMPKDKKNASGKGSSPDGKGVMNSSLSINEALDMLPGPMRELMTSGLRALNGQKSKHVQLIMNARGNRFTKAQLVVKDVDELEAMAALCTNARRGGVAAGLEYLGAADGSADNGFDLDENGDLVTNEGEEKDPELLPLPTMNNFGNKGKKAGKQSAAMAAAAADNAD